MTGKHRGPDEGPSPEMTARRHSEQVGARVHQGDDRGRGVDGLEEALRFHEAGLRLVGGRWRPRDEPLRLAVQLVALAAGAIDPQLSAGLAWSALRPLVVPEVAA